MKVILEGCDGTGKSTVAKAITKTAHADVMHATTASPQDFDSYVKRLDIDNVIFDRSFISEYVYSRVYKRSILISDVQLSLLLELAKAKGIVIFIFVGDVDAILDRINKRGPEEEQVKQNLTALMKEYEYIASLYPQYIHKINVDGNIEDVINNVKDVLLNNA